jgi:hypothetical protein
MGSRIASPLLLCFWFTALSPKPKQLSDLAAEPQEGHMRQKLRSSNIPLLYDAAPAVPAYEQMAHLKSYIEYRNSSSFFPSRPGA